MTKSLLFVCLGNICRSPAAEAVFLHQAKIKGLEGKYLVDSAGTGNWHQGSKADSRMRKAALKRGINIESRARQIVLDDFQLFDLILTMDNSNLADVKSLSKQNKNQITSTIRPLLSFSKKTSLVEVPDPYYGGENGFDDVIDLIEGAIESLFEFLKN
tara:strand:- start:57 stop:530 length:474 start_codon:yes stop_codon:yes gene_type:complete